MSNQNEAWRDYRTQELRLQVPGRLKDKTVQILSLTDEGPSDFNVVISRGPAQQGEQLEDIGERLERELKAALPQFHLIERQAAEVSAQACQKLKYRWKRDTVLLEQWQTVLMVEGPEGPEVLMLTATMPQGLEGDWQAVYETMVGSVQVERPWPKERVRAAEPQAQQEAPPRQGCVFGLRGVSLKVCADVQALMAQAPPAEVFAGLWKFYDPAGAPLAVKWAHEPKKNWLGKTEVPASYSLEPAGEGSDLSPLRSRVALVEKVEGELESVEAVWKQLLDAAQ